MSEFNVTVPGGESLRLLTGGKYCPADILVTAEGGTPVVEKDINFWDYDGELLYSYTLDELQALTELPPAPTPKKDFLVFDEWNWTLEQIKSLNLPVDVGATYNTIDGKTYAVIEVTDPAKMTITLNYYQKKDHFSINWGDGSPDEVYTESNTYKTLVHTYANLGQYTITVEASNLWAPGKNNANEPFIGSGDSDTLSGLFLKEVFLGRNVLVFNYGFYRTGLEAITLPKSMNYQDSRSNYFRYCCHLKTVIYPSDCPGFSSYHFRDAHSLSVCSVPYNATIMSDFAYDQLKRFTASPNLKTFSVGSYTSIKEVFIAEGVETLGSNCFAFAVCLKNVDLPSTIKSVGSASFQGCYSLMRLRFRSATPPTVANATAFGSFPPGCIVEVPAGSLAAYQSATNYGTIAAQMVGV